MIRTKIKKTKTLNIKYKKYKYEKNNLIMCNRNFSQYECKR